MMRKETYATTGSRMAVRFFGGWDFTEDDMRSRQPAFVGYGNEGDNTVIELTYNWDTSHYDMGNGFGHLAIEVDDVYAAAEKIRAQGGKIIREPGPMNAGTTIIAFVEDPDGYPIELLAPR